MNEQDIKQIYKLLGRFSRYTQQFEQEEMKHGNRQGEKTETLGTVQTRMADTRTPYQRTDRTIPKTINGQADEAEPPIL